MPIGHLDASTAPSTPPRQHGSSSSSHPPAGVAPLALPSPPAARSAEHALRARPPLSPRSFGGGGESEGATGSPPKRCPAPQAATAVVTAAGYPGAAATTMPSLPSVASRPPLRWLSPRRRRSRRARSRRRSSKQRAQQLLRERSELAIDLEGLQETLGRMSRAVGRAREQAEALAAEGARGGASDARRHTAQLQSLSKAVLREKQRRLSARNELGALQRQIAKKRPPFEELAERVASLRRRAADAADATARAERAVEESSNLRSQLARCEEAIRVHDATTPPPPSDASPGGGGGGRAAELQGRLEALRRAIAREQLTRTDAGAASARSPQAPQTPRTPPVPPHSQRGRGRGHAARAACAPRADRRGGTLR